MLKRVGITGISGFIAAYAAEACLASGYEVLGLDHHQKDKVHYPEGVELFIGDMRDETAMVEFAAHVDGIIHLAGVLGTQETIKNPRPSVESNVKGGLNFLEACNQYNLPGVNICVGNFWFNNSYSISKNTVERLADMFNKDRGGRINQLRCVNAYGPRQLAAAPFAHGKVRKITPALVCRALSGMPMELYGGGVQVSDMVWVGDVAKALVMALEHAEKGDVFDHVVEIGSVEETTVLDVANLVNRLVSEKLGTAPVDIVSLPMRPGELVGEKVRADVSTLDLIGFDVADLVPLEKGMADTIDYFESMRGTAWTSPPPA